MHCREIGSGNVPFCPAAEDDDLAAAYLTRAARRFAAYDPAAHSYLMEMARTLRIEALHRAAHAPHSDMP